MNDEFFSGELARTCGVSPDTIRHYERLGVLPAAVRGANGYRRFPREAAGRVMLIRRALAIGFSLAGVARILSQRDDGSPPCRAVRALAGEKLDTLDRRIAEMTAMREDLARMIEQWDVRLAATRDGEAARLLEEGTPASSPAGPQASSPAFCGAPRTAPRQPARRQRSMKG
ncbi:MAG TPA: heavy metal-responsive transcriptional regulator [Thermoanaerobaculia bacterium]|jgi:DNA-binding transcriptional MerR regulator|nr:heavy metal-responsive transcriptional regulator [Thermoanaerobaculia bacterium]